MKESYRGTFRRPFLSVIARSARLLSTALVVVLATSCAPDGDPQTSGSGGSGSSGVSTDAGSATGTAGRTGTGGSAARGPGSGGNNQAGGNTGTAGTAGTAGNAGTAGTAGTAGNAGTGGRVGTGGRLGTGGMTSSGGRAGTGAGGSVGAGGSGVVGPTVAPRLAQCRFHFGTLDSRAKGQAALISEIDMFTPGWVGSSESFNMASVCTAARAGGALAGVVPAVVAYVIAFTARRDQGLQDCNVTGTTNLCKYGATYIRAHLEDRIIPQYAKYAQGFASACGTSQPMLWLMEPDYYQYSTGGDANELTPTEAGQIMGRLVATVRASLPNALFSLDISPWIPNEGRDWYSHFDMNDFAFINTSGGGTDGGAVRIRASNTMTWAGVHRVTGKPILADTGYGVAGAPTGHDPQWDSVANINARIADGVVGITQYNPMANWSATIGQIRSQLTAVPCP